MVEHPLPGPDEPGAEASLSPPTDGPARAEGDSSGETTLESAPEGALAAGLVKEPGPEDLPYAAADLPLPGPAPRPGARPFPPAAALLNLTGLGLGYLYLRRWVRWAIHLAGTAALLTAAYLMNAASHPWVWLAVGTAWLLWMVVDGWLQAARLRRSAAGQPAGRWWLPTAVGAAAVALTLVGVWTYLSYGDYEFRLGRAAYRSGDCQRAIHYLSRVTSLYELTLSGNVAVADDTIVECGLFGDAQAKWQRASYEEAAAGYQAYLERYPGGGLVPLAREGAAQVYRDWGAALRRDQQQETAIGKYQVILERYPETAAGQEATALSAEAYAEWALALRQQAQYSQALAHYDTILAQYPATPGGQQAAAWAAETLALWAAELRQAGEHQEAIEKYRLVLQRYPDTPTGRQSANLAAAAYEEWAAQLRQAGRYEEALEKYRIVLEQYPDTPTGQQAAGLSAAAYEEWAAQLRQAGRYEEAIAHYRTVLADFPNTPTGQQAASLLAATYWDWAAQLRQEGDFTRALAHYRTLSESYADTAAGQQAADMILVTYQEWAEFSWKEKAYSAAIARYRDIAEKYPGTPAAAAAPLNIGRIYNDWGQELTGSSEFNEAMEKHNLAQGATDDAEVIASAKEGYNRALQGLARDTTGEGKALLDEALANACAGKASDSPAIGLLQDEAGRAYAGGVFTLPDDLLATMPGHLRYAVCRTTGTTVLERCPYSGGHTLVRQRHWWRVSVRSPLTGRVLYERTFNGGNPMSCPFSRSFSQTVEYSSGSYPSRDTVFEWLRGIVR